MTTQTWLRKFAAQENINFLLTNRIPRMALTHFMGWFSQIKHPWVKRPSIAIWKMFTDLDLSEARKDQFESMHDCFIRELKPGARSVDTRAEILTSPCDGIVGACGRVVDGQLYQAKGFPYTLEDLLGPQDSTHVWRNGWFVTIRITSSMYHRFHAPYSGTMTRVQYFSGDTWNVNPIALKRVEKLFCKNERAYLNLSIGEKAYPVAMVPVAAILVASIRLHGIDTLFSASYQGATVIDSDVSFEKGQELGWFQHGSTILLFVPEGFVLAPGVQEGVQLKMGEPLLVLPSA